MTVDEAWKTLTSDPMPERIWMLLTVCSLCLDDRGQYDAAEWCSLAAGDSSNMKDVPSIWVRAVSVLRLPEDVRRAAQWN